MASTLGLHVDIRGQQTLTSSLGTRRPRVLGSRWSMWTLSMFISSPSTLRLNVETEMGREGGADQ